MSLNPHLSETFLFVFLLYPDFKMSPIDTEDLIDYEDDVPTGTTGVSAANSASSGAVADGDDKDKKNFSGIHSTGFRYVLRISSVHVLIML